MKKLLAILFFIFELCLVQAQTNLVPNPSFEDTLDCPIGDWRIMTCKDWFCVYPANGDQFTNNITQCDYYNSCSQLAGYNNSNGFQIPKTGVAYSDLLVYYDPIQNTRLYLECELTQTLEKNKFYVVNFFVSLANKSKFYTNAIAAHFSPNKIEKFDYSYLQTVSHVIGKEKIKDTLDWVEISGIYTAEGGGNFIVLGNFFSDANSVFDTLQGNLAYESTYYIDDVSVTLCDTCKDVDTTKSNNLFIPDIFSPNGDGVNDKLFVRGNNIKELYFAVYDRWGEKVFESTDKNNAWDGTYKGNTLNGAVFVYYCFGKYNDGAEFKQKGDVSLIR